VRSNSNARKPAAAHGAALLAPPQRLINWRDASPLHALRMPEVLVVLGLFASCRPHPWTLMQMSRVLGRGPLVEDPPLVAQLLDIKVSGVRNETRGGKVPDV